LKSKIDLVNAEVNYSDSKIELVRAENAYQSALIKLNNTMYVAYAPEYSIKNTESFNFSENDYANISILKEDLGKYEKFDTIEGETVYTSSVEKSEVLKDYTFVPYEYKFQDVLDLANEQRPDLKSFIATYSAMQEALKYTKREYFPDLTGKVGYTHRNTNYFVSNGMSFSASLDFPTINIMNTKHKIDESKAQLDVAMDNVNLAKQNIYFEVQNAYVNLLQIEKRIPLMAVKVRQTLENFELADGRYAVGLGNFIELQDAKNNYNKAQQAYVQTVFDYNIAKATLEKAMGEK
jgi:outer membrane protein TolC